MLSSILLLKLLMSFITGGLFVTITLYAAERYGTDFGGLIAGMPSTTAVGLFFIGYVQSPVDASVAGIIVPAAVAGSVAFVILYVMLCRRLGYMNAILISSVAWLLVSLPLAFLKIDEILISTIFFIVFWIISIFYISKHKQHIRITEGIKQKPEQVISRALFAGFVVSSAVLISNLFGPIYGGIVASFPAIFLTTFIILCRDYGTEYSIGFAKTTPLGLFGVVPYAWGVHYFYPEYGIITGTMLSYILSFAGVGIIYILLRKCG